MEGESVISMDNFSSMSLYSELMGAVSILRESFKILLRSGKLTASTTIMTLIPNSLLFLSNILSIKLLLFDLFTKSHLLYSIDPFAMDFFELVLCIKEDIQVLSGVKLIFFLTYSLVTLFSILTLLFSSTTSYSSKNFEPKELISKIGRTWVMPLITWVYITLMGIGYTLLLVGLIGLLMLNSDGLAAMIFAGGVLLILSISLFLHSAVIWMSGLVIFVVEESCYGIETVERSKEFMNGGTLHWIVLNLLSMVTGYVMLIAFQLLKFNQTLLALFIVGLIIVNVICLMKIFSLMAYMVFYYQCKKRYGDELEWPLQMGYSSLIDVFV
ncbi:uncharacterized protein LOC122659159 [Telopea speciosissima]|uniref:uncharacterized protein LOC122659159 n=1 Tax=Telopea speciosissima TaxID=54955 RepID=UPI001CC66BC2|nr:uncharacterized protein LOC122659159 [Telopea speciosissima]